MPSCAAGGEGQWRTERRGDGGFAVGALECCQSSTAASAVVFFGPPRHLINIIDAAAGGDARRQSKLGRDGTAEREHRAAARRRHLAAAERPLGWNASKASAGCASTACGVSHAADRQAYFCSTPTRSRIAPACSGCRHGKFRRPSKSLIRETIRDRGYRTVTEAIQGAPGVTAGDFPAEPSSFSMRGLTNSQITTLYNGIKIGPQNMTSRARALQSRPRGNPQRSGLADVW